ncbi:hypothetical protein CTEN210_03414 [Chaetoceros tenuissimus]|uniref:non-specific serine/threonine protein kinase n=1 Tax=Chaetoceros tenuissimus TaxID=426638 RepID=A0AAD3H1I7_9STRA|nr:hypothetical protein CTEN210_03414 [Chaetoceros tenuissimus]
MTSSFINANYDIPRNTGIKAFRDIEKYYKQIRCVGHGGFASVFLAKKLSSEKEYAIKIFHNEVISDEYLVENRRRRTSSTTGDANDEEEIEAFTRELAVLNKLRVNPDKDARDLSIVYVKEYFQATNFAAIVMAYANGGTLAELIDKKGNEENSMPFSERRICWYALQLSEALSYAHERNIYHHDVKSSNVLIDRQEGGKLVLTDWGSAIGEGEESFTISQLYASPELQSEYNRVSEQEESDNDTENSGIIVEGDKNDAFGLGCIILELIYCQKLVNIAEENIADIISTKGVDAVLDLPSLRLPWLSAGCDTSHEDPTIGYSYELRCFAKSLLELDPSIRYTPKEIAGPLRDDPRSPLLQSFVVAAETTILGDAITMDNIQLGMFIQFSYGEDDFDSEEEEEEADKCKIIHKDCIGVVVGLDPDGLYANCAFPTALFSFKLKSVRIGASKTNSTELKPRFEVIVGPSVDLQIDGYHSTISGCVSFQYLQRVLGIEHASRLRMGHVINPKCVVVFLDTERDIAILAPTKKNKVIEASAQPGMFPLVPWQVDPVEKKSPSVPQYWDTNEMKIVEETEPRQREIVTNLFFADRMDIQEYEILSIKRVQCNILWSIFAKKSVSIASENFGNWNWQRLFLGTFDYDPESLLLHDPTSFFYPSVHCNGLTLTGAFGAHRSRYEANNLNKIVLARAAVGKLSRDLSTQYHSKMINGEVQLPETSQVFPEYIITYRRLEGARVRQTTSTGRRRVRTNQNINLRNMMEAVTLNSRPPRNANMVDSTASSGISEAFLSSNNIPTRSPVAMGRRSLKPEGSQLTALKQREGTESANASIKPDSTRSPNEVKATDKALQKSSTKKCVICLERDVRKLLLPCGHPCLCEVCGTEQGLSKLKHKCPECRAKVKTVVSFFGRVVND